MEYIIGRLPKNGDKVKINGNGVEGVVIGLLSPARVERGMAQNPLTSEYAAIVGIKPLEDGYKEIRSYHPFDLQIKN